MASQNGTADSGSDTAVFRLQDLPPETRQNVFRNFVPDRLPVGSSLPLSDDILKCRRTLLNLCRTSKECYDLALPLVYRYIIITNYIQMAGLLVNLIFNDNRQSWMWSLAVLVEFPPEYPDMDDIPWNVGFISETILRFHRLAIQNPRSALVDTVEVFLLRLKFVLPGIPVDPANPDRGYFDADNSWNRYSRLLYKACRPFLMLILRFQTNIEDILVTVPNGFVQQLCPPQKEARIIRQFQSDPNIPASENPFKKLRSIRKQAGPNMPTYVRCKPDPLRPEYFSSKEWEFYWDDGSWFFNRYLDEQGWPRPIEPPWGLMVFSHITDLALYGSATNAAQLRLILSSCKNLKSLIYTTNTTDWSYRFVPLPATEYREEVPVPTLQQALDEVRETLTYLCLKWIPWKGYLTEGEQAALARNLVDVGDFPLLTDSDIDMIFVRGNYTALD